MITKQLADRKTWHEEYSVMFLLYKYHCTGIGRSLPMTLALRRLRCTSRTTRQCFVGTNLKDTPDGENDGKSTKRFFSSNSTTSKDLSSSSQTTNITITDNNDNDNSNSSLLRLLRMNKTEWPTIGLAASTLVLTSSVTLLLPYASGTVIDYTIASGENGGTSPVILASGLFMLSSLAGGGVYLRTLMLAKAGNRIVARIKQQLYSSILQKDSAYLDMQTTGDLLSRLTSDAQLLHGVLTTQAISGLRATVMSAGAGGMLLYTSPSLAMISCATLPPVFILTRYFSRRLKQRQEKVQKLLGEATSLAEQALNHTMTIKQTCAESYETVRYRNGVAAAHKESVETAHMQAQLEAGSHIAANAAILGVLGMGGNMVVDGSITAGDLTGFVMYSLLLAGNLSSLTSTYGELVRASAASSRIFELMDEPCNMVSSKGMAEHRKLLLAQNDPLVQIEYDSHEDNNKIHVDHNALERSTTHTTSSNNTDNNLSPGAASIELRNLSFRYPSRRDITVLDNMNLTIPAGSIVALVGASGSGKVRSNDQIYHLLIKTGVCT